jgi:hypothetical protein
VTAPQHPAGFIGTRRLMSGPARHINPDPDLHRRFLLATSTCQRVFSGDVEEHQTFAIRDRPQVPSPGS